MAAPRCQKREAIAGISAAEMQSRQDPMKIVLAIIGILSIAVGLFWVGQGTGLLAGPHSAVLIDFGAGVGAPRDRPCVVGVAIAQNRQQPIGRPIRARNGTSWRTRQN